MRLIALVGAFSLAYGGASLDAEFAFGCYINVKDTDCCCPHSTPVGVMRERVGKWADEPCLADSWEDSGAELEEHATELATGGDAPAACDAPPDGIIVSAPALCGGGTRVERPDFGAVQKKLRPRGPRSLSGAAKRRERALWWHHLHPQADRGGEPLTRIIVPASVAKETKVAGSAMYATRQ